MLAIARGRPRPQNHRDGLLVHAVEGIEAPLAQRLAGGGVQEEQPDDRQHDRDHDQEPVDVADRPPLLRERAPRDEVHISGPG